MTDRYAKARAARREGDPHWRDQMPLRWRLGRWWWIYRYPMYALGALLTILAGALIAVFR